MTVHEEQVARRIGRELLYEYRVVCADGMQWGDVHQDRGRALRMVETSMTVVHSDHEHTIERRLIGPWEAT